MSIPARNSVYSLPPSPYCHNIANVMIQLLCLHDAFSLSNSNSCSLCWSARRRRATTHGTKPSARPPPTSGASSLTISTMQEMRSAPSSSSDFLCVLVNRLCLVLIGYWVRATSLFVLLRPFLSLLKTSGRCDQGYLCFD